MAARRQDVSLSNQLAPNMKILKALRDKALAVSLIGPHTPYTPALRAHARLATTSARRTATLHRRATTVQHCYANPTAPHAT